MASTSILPMPIYEALVDRLLESPELLDLAECPVTGNFERYLVENKLGGDFDIWLERHRASLEIYEVDDRPAFLVELCPQIIN